MLDMLGNVAEFGNANVFMAKDGVVYTPAPNGTFLNGITRQRVIDLLRGDGVTVIEKTLRYEDFNELTRSSRPGTSPKSRRSFGSTTASCRRAASTRGRESSIGISRTRDGWPRRLPFVIARSDSDEAIHSAASGGMDCFASLAMTMFLLRSVQHQLGIGKIGSRGGAGLSILRPRFSV